MLPALTAGGTSRWPPDLCRCRPPLNDGSERLPALERVGLGRPASSTVLASCPAASQQRVAVARALVSEPDLILADEPTGALDSKSAPDIIVLLDELTPRPVGRSCFITHDADVAGVANAPSEFSTAWLPRFTELAS